LINLLFASILLTTASFGGGCSADAYQQFEKKICKNSLESEA
jgi:hypothetical protein